MKNYIPKGMNKFNVDFFYVKKKDLYEVYEYMRKILPSGFFYPEDDEIGDETLLARHSSIDITHYNSKKYAVIIFRYGFKLGTNNDINLNGIMIATRLVKKLLKKFTLYQPSGEEKVIGVEVCSDIV